MTRVRKDNRRKKVDKHEERVKRGMAEISEDNTRRNKKIQPLQAMNERQKDALIAFNNHQLVVLSGSAGTGKTELICWYACKLWLEGRIDNIVITRPYQHLGADYGAIKGDDTQKLLPFCMSILAKLKKYLGVGILRNNFKMDAIEALFAEADGIQIVPIEKIQGLSFGERTLIIADELQNAQVAQIKALTTRAEEGCQILCAGDPRQTAVGPDNGLNFLEDVLGSYPTSYAKVIHFQKDDVVRGGLAGYLVSAFEEMGDW